MQKLEKNAQAWAVTAWRLRDGDAVYRRADGGWAERFDDAEVFTIKADADAGLANAENDAKARIVVGPYLFQVVEDDGHPTPASVREKIRSQGPTDRRDVGKQAART